MQAFLPVLLGAALLAAQPAGAQMALKNGTVLDTAKVRLGPSTAAPEIGVTLSKGSTVAVPCQLTGSSFTHPTLGTSNQWHKTTVGFVNQVYIRTSRPGPPCPSNVRAQAAIAFGRLRTGTRYVGCGAGTFRSGTVADRDYLHKCTGQRDYFQPKGSTGFDCSGLMVQMFKAAGTTLDEQSSSAIKNSKTLIRVGKANIRPGDMLATYGHVVMYIGLDSKGVPSVIESTPYKKQPDGSWLGTRVSAAKLFLDSAAYSVHRHPAIA